MEGRSGTAGGEETQPLRVLFVCEGNVCRSPSAELLLRAALPPSVVQPASAGLDARVGDPVAAETAELLAADGVTASGFVARALEEAMLTDADLVVTMTGAQRSAVVRRVPSVLRRTWTLLDLAGTVRSSRLTLVDGHAELQAARTRALGDVPDPWGRGATAHRRSYGMVKEAVAWLASGVR